MDYSHMEEALLQKTLRMAQEGAFPLLQSSNEKVPASSKNCPIMARNAWAMGIGKKHLTIRRCAFQEDCPQLRSSLLVDKLFTGTEGSDEEYWYRGEPEHDERESGDIDRVLAEESYLLTGNDLVVLDDGSRDPYPLDFSSLEEGEPEDDEIPSIEGLTVVTLEEMEEEEILRIIVIKEYRTPTPLFKRKAHPTTLCGTYIPEGWQPSSKKKAKQMTDRRHDLVEEMTTLLRTFPKRPPVPETSVTRKERKERSEIEMGWLRRAMEALSKLV